MAVTTVRDQRTLLQDYKLALQTTVVKQLERKSSAINSFGLASVVNTIGLALSTFMYSHFRLERSYSPMMIGAFTSFLIFAQSLELYSLSRKCSSRSQPFRFITAIWNAIHDDAKVFFPSFKKEAVVSVLGIGGIITGTYLQNRMLSVGGLLLNLGAQITAFVKAKMIIQSEQKTCQFMLRYLESICGGKGAKPEAPKTPAPKKPLFPVKPENFKSYVAQFEGKVKQRRTDLPMAAIWDTLKSAYSNFLPAQKIALKAEYEKAARLFQEYQKAVGSAASVSAAKPKTKT